MQGQIVSHILVLDLISSRVKINWQNYLQGILLQPTQNNFIIFGNKAFVLQELLQLRNLHPVWVIGKGPVQTKSKRSTCISSLQTTKFLYTCLGYLSSAVFCTFKPVIISGIIIQLPSVGNTPWPSFDQLLHYLNSTCNNTFEDNTKNINLNKNLKNPKYATNLSENVLAFIYYSILYLNHIITSNFFL